MRPKLALSLLPLLGAFVIAAPAQARDISGTSTLVIRADTDEFSSVIRKKRKRVVVVQPIEHRAIGWRSADPSFDHYGRPYRPPANLAGCAIDLGYGRWASCHITQ